MPTDEDLEAISVELWKACELGIVVRNLDDDGRLDDADPDDDADKVFRDGLDNDDGYPEINEDSVNDKLLDILWLLEAMPLDTNDKVIEDLEKVELGLLVNMLETLLFDVNLFLATVISETNRVKPLAVTLEIGVDLTEILVALLDWILDRGRERTLFPLELNKELWDLELLSIVLDEEIDVKMLVREIFEVDRVDNEAPWLDWTLEVDLDNERLFDRDPVEDLIKPLWTVLDKKEDTRWLRVALATDVVKTVVLLNWKLENDGDDLCPAVVFLDRGNEDARPPWLIFDTEAGAERVLLLALLEAISDEIWLEILPDWDREECVFLWLIFELCMVEEEIICLLELNLEDETPVFTALDEYTNDTLFLWVAFEMEEREDVILLKRALERDFDGPLPLFLPLGKLLEDSGLLWTVLEKWECAESVDLLGLWLEWTESLWEEEGVVVSSWVEEDLNSTRLFEKTLDLWVEDPDLLREALERDKCIEETILLVTILEGEAELSEILCWWLEESRDIFLLTLLDTGAEKRRVLEGTLERLEDDVAPNEIKLDGRIVEALVLWIPNEECKDVWLLLGVLLDICEGLIPLEMRVEDGDDEITLWIVIFDWEIAETILPGMETDECLMLEMKLVRVEVTALLEMTLRDVVPLWTLTLELVTPDTILLGTELDGDIYCLELCEVIFEWADDLIILETIFECIEATRLGPLDSEWDTVDAILLEHREDLGATEWDIAVEVIWFTVVRLERDRPNEVLAREWVDWDTDDAEMLEIRLEAATEYMALLRAPVVDMDILVGKPLEGITCEPMLLGTPLDADLSNVKLLEATLEMEWVNSKLLEIISEALEEAVLEVWALLSWPLEIRTEETVFCDMTLEGECKDSDAILPVLKLNELCNGIESVLDNGVDDCGEERLSRLINERRTVDEEEALDFVVDGLREVDPDNATSLDWVVGEPGTEDGKLLGIFGEVLAAVELILLDAESRERPLEDDERGINVDVEAWRLCERLLAISDESRSDEATEFTCMRDWDDGGVGPVDTKRDDRTEEVIDTVVRGFRYVVREDSGEDRIEDAWTGLECPTDACLDPVDDSFLNADDTRVVLTKWFPDVTSSTDLDFFECSCGVTVVWEALIFESFLEGANVLIIVEGIADAGLSWYSWECVREGLILEDPFGIPSWVDSCP